MFLASRLCPGAFRPAPAGAMTAPVAPGFALHPQLAADTVEVARAACCRVLLMNDAQYPWLILVPQRPGLRDFHDLAGADMAAAVAEIGAASRALQALYSPAKINVAALGNMVAQLHIHVIARDAADPAWPRPVWGVVPAVPYAPAALAARLAELRAALAAEDIGDGLGEGPGGGTALA